MRVKIILLMIAIGCLSGCQSSQVRNVKDVDYSKISGTWRDEKSPWQIKVSDDGKVESALFPMGEVVIIPNETVYVEMRDGSQSSYESGDFLLAYDPEEGQLEITIKVEKMYVKYLDNVVEGHSETLFIGDISEDGKVWEGFKVEEFDYGPRFPQGEVAPSPTKLIKSQ